MEAWTRMVFRYLIYSLGLLCILTSCRSGQQVRDPEYAQLSYAAHQARLDSVATPQAVSPVIDEFSGPQPLEAFIQYAIFQNAGVQAARKRIDAAAMRVPQAASLKDPMLDVAGWPFYSNVPQTASGRMTVDMKVSQEVPWFGKLDKQAAAAEAEVNAARAQLAAVELKVIEEVKRSYFELYYVHKAIRVITKDREILADLIEVADALYVTGKSSQQAVLRLQAELFNVDGELIKMEQMRESARAELAQVLHISPDTPLETVDELSSAEDPRNLQTLYEQAVRDRPELHAMLAEINRDQHRVDRARLEYYPDVTFKLGWGELNTNGATAPSADGTDTVTLGLGVNLPIYRNRLRAAVYEAESTAVASARQYDQMKDETQRDVKQLFTQAISQRDTEALFRESIIPKTEQALEVAMRGYQVGQTDFADLIANWRELLKFHLTQLQLETQYRQTLASLERVVGGIPLSPVEFAPLPTVDLESVPEDQSPNE